ncbi:MAG: ornithine carbamoyltransferase [Candidatus Omnitrophota bacterium]|nr:ornithine carbamoyltransferase [Candidatus Omnitrophota bacterium]MBU1929419.1 ornithine carbamoyltransferase [Candidatus Omnitrophota bacterium]MBU2034896.1 ornithine carbamoyltransferase [Candidatus Omnitrophota bacterium]MBU2221300.1 ornithine carbamoyltransferase [Candidatus Omnitrophota bacterium]
MKKDLIGIKDLNSKEVEELLELTSELKNDPAKFDRTLKGKSLALIFEKPSNRTYVSFQVGMYELGGNSIYLGPEHIKLGVRESIPDIARTLSRYVDGIVFRTFAQKSLLEMAKYSKVPVINGLSDLTHPCQGLADIYTIKEKFGKFKGLILVYIGDGNNVCHSLLYAASKVGLNLNIATPKGYAPDPAIVEETKKIGNKTGCRIKLFLNPQEAVKGADVIYTDVWASMGQETEAKKREKAFKDFQVNNGLVKKAFKNALIMHCLPAHRGLEITSEIMDSLNSIVFDQAENRMHVQKAILIKLLAPEANGNED